MSVIFETAYLKLGLAALLPVAVSAAVYLINKKTPFGRLDEKYKQMIFGVIFGCLAVLGTEWGIPIEGAQLNCRDAAVLTAGLLFGGPAGITAGLIGGIERWIAAAWGVGSFTRTACTLSTIIAGFYAALLRKLLFEDKKPGWMLALAIGVVMEVFHMTMVFITNISEPVKAMAAVKICSLPMISANAFSVMLSTIVISLLAGEKLIKNKENRNISQRIQRWMLISVIFAFALTSVFVFRLQDKLSDMQRDSQLSIAIEDVLNDVETAPDSSIITTNRHIGENGLILILGEDGSIESATSGCDKKELEEILSDISLPEAASSEDIFTIDIGGAKFDCRCRYAKGRYVLSALPRSEIHEVRDIAISINVFLEVLVFALLFALIYLLIKKIVVNQLKSVTGSLARITGGDLDEVVDVRTSEEFASLSDDINSTVDTLKKYIEEASARIDRELEFAKQIQTSSLPSVFPAFPGRTDLDIYASMDPAKEVGGDFYDLYIMHSNIINFLIADVSGKGIPAAMFMMKAKTELKGYTEADMALGDVFTYSNDALCEGNDAGMFVTAWQGSLDLGTGALRYVNAGHNPPLIKRGDGGFEYLRSGAGFVLAGMEGMRYSMREMRLQPGDIIFLYTDGVTEAMNADEQLYGEQRLLDIINSAVYEDMKELCGIVKDDVDRFTGDAPQFDDITMLALKFTGEKL